MAKRRARNLDDHAIEHIVCVLDGWSGKLSWDLLIEAIETVSYTHLTLPTKA